MAEDFTTYSTRGAEIGDVTITANKLDCNLTEEDDAGVYDDKGAAHFTNAFSHLVEITFRAAANTVKRMASWALTNTPESPPYWHDNVSESCYLACECDGGGSRRLDLEESENNDFDASTNLGLNTKFYETIVRSGGNGEVLTVSIRKDSHGGELRDTIVITLTNDRSYRYVHGVSSRDEAPGTSDDLQLEYDIENLDLQEPGDEWGLAGAVAGSSAVAGTLSVTTRTIRRHPLFRTSLAVRGERPSLKQAMRSS